MPIRARIIGPAADGQLNAFIRKLADYHRGRGQALVEPILAEAVPTLQVLLSHASTSSPVEPKANPYAARTYQVDEETQARIDGNTIVGVDGMALRVGTGEGSDHDRPLVPLGDLPQKWRAALAQKINGGVRRAFALDYAKSFLQEALKKGPVQAYGFNRMARSRGVNVRALREAKAALGVKVTGKGKKATLSM